MIMTIMIFPTTMEDLDVIFAQLQMWITNLHDEDEHHENK